MFFKSHIYQSSQQISARGGPSRLLDDLLQLAVVPSLNTTLGPSREHFFHLPPMFSFLQYIPANLQIFLKLKLLPHDTWSQIIEISLSDLLGSVFFIRRELLGSLVLMSFHFQPYSLTKSITIISYCWVQRRSLVDIEMRLYLLQHIFWVRSWKYLGIYFHSNFQTSTNFSKSLSYSAVQWHLRCCSVEQCNFLKFYSTICRFGSQRGEKHFYSYGRCPFSSTLMGGDGFSGCCGVRAQWKRGNQKQYCAGKKRVVQLGWLINIL